MTQMMARSMINDGWLIMSLTLTFIFGHYLSKKMRHDGWYASLDNQAAVSLFVYFAGESIARGWSVMLLWTYAHGGDAAAVESKYLVGLVGASVALVGAVCCVRIFAPDKWGFVGWITGPILAVAFYFVLEHL